MVWLFLLLWINKTELFRGDTEAGADLEPRARVRSLEKRWWCVEICERCIGSSRHGRGVKVWALSYTCLYHPSEILRDRVFCYLNPTCEDIDLPEKLNDTPKITVRILMYICLFETGSCCVALVVLGLAMWPRQALHSMPTLQGYVWLTVWIAV